MHPPDLVQELGHRLNLTGLTLHDGVCRLVFDQSLPIDLEDDGLGNLCFHAIIGSLPHEGREAMLTALLSAHLFGLETDGAVFGLHPKTDELYLFRSLAVDTLTVDHALDVLERFTHQAESWTERIKALVRENSPTAHGAEPLGSEALRA
jgi:hypothetical protein